MIQTLDALIAALRASPDAPAHFAGDDTRTQGGWHVTRLTRSVQSHVDCDGTREDGTETVIQLLDASRGTAMPVARLTAILAKSATAIPGLGQAALRVHWRARRWRVEAVDGGTIRLVPDAEACRPALRCAC